MTTPQVQLMVREPVTKCTCSKNAADFPCGFWHVTFAAKIVCATKTLEVKIHN